MQKIEDGEKAWKFDGTVGLNAAATGLVNWAAGGKNNVNGIAYAKGIPIQGKSYGAEGFIDEKGKVIKEGEFDDSCLFGTSIL